LGVVTNNASVQTVVIEEEFAIALPSPNLFWAIANVGGSQSFPFLELPTTVQSSQKEGP